MEDLDDPKMSPTPISSKGEDKLVIRIAHGNTCSISLYTREEVVKGKQMYENRLCVPIGSTETKDQDEEARDSRWQRHGTAWIVMALAGVLWAMRVPLKLGVVVGRSWSRRNVSVGHSARGSSNAGCLVM